MIYSWEGNRRSSIKQPCIVDFCGIITCGFNVREREDEQPAYMHDVTWNSLPVFWTENSEQRGRDADSLLINSHQRGAVQLWCKHNWLQFLNKYQSFICNSRSRDAITFISVSLEDEDAVALTAAAAEYYQRYLAHFQQDPTKWVDQHVVSEHIEVSVREAAAFFTLSIRNSAHDSNAHNTSIQHSTWQINTT